jgi:hypothetical protein
LTDPEIISLVHCVKIHVAYFQGLKKIWGAHFNLEIGMLEQLKGRKFKILKIISWKIKILKKQNLERSKS